jgi:hypothetical protein
MNAVLVKREPQDDGRVFITTRALQMRETTYVEKMGDQVVDADKDLLITGGWQPGEEAKAEIENLVRDGLSLDAAFWRVSGWDNDKGKEDAVEQEKTDPTASAENEREAEIASQTSAEPTADAGGETPKEDGDKEPA